MKRKRDETDGFVCECGIKIGRKDNYKRHQERVCPRSAKVIRLATAQTTVLQELNVEAADRLHSTNTANNDLRRRVQNAERTHVALKRRLELEQQNFLRIGNRLRKKRSRINSLLTKLREPMTAAQKPYDELTSRGKRRRRAAAWQHLEKKFGREAAPLAMIQALLSALTLSALFNLIHSATSTVVRATARFIESSLRKKLQQAARAPQNFNRTVSTIFGGYRLMTRKKFNHIQARDRDATKMGMPIIPHVTYNEVYLRMRNRLHIRDILSDVSSLVATEEGVSIHGRFRQLEPVLLQLAQKCLHVFGGAVKWQTEPFTFHVSLGADAFPVHKMEITTFYATLLEFGSKFIHSPSNRFLLFISPTKEDSDVSKAYARHFVKQLLEIIGRPYQVRYWNGTEWQTVTVTFGKGAVAADQKGVCGLAGELSNAATYFSTYVSASKSIDSAASSEEHNEALADGQPDIEGRLGNTDVARFGATVGSGQGQLKPYTFSTRMVDLKRLENTISADAEKRSRSKRQCQPAKINILCKKLGTRQKEMPSIGVLVDDLAICSLHVILLSWHYFFYHLLDSILPQVQRFSTETDIRSLFLNEVNQIGCGKVAKVLRNKGSHNEWRPPRLMGMDCHKLSVGFPRLTHLLERFLPCSNASESVMAELTTYHYLGILLRNISSMISRTTATQTSLNELKDSCIKYHTLKTIIRGRTQLKQNDFTVGVVIPYQAELWYGRFPGAGLGLFSTQGVESKHSEIKQILHEAQPQTKWDQCFLVDMLRNFDLVCELRVQRQDYTTARVYKFIPELKGNVCRVCRFEHCKFCNDEEVRGLWNAICDSATSGRLDPLLRDLLS